MSKENEIDTSCCEIPRKDICDLVDNLPVQYQKACTFHNIFMQPFLDQINCLYDSMEQFCGTINCKGLKGDALTAYGSSVGFPREQCNASCLGDGIIRDDELYCRLIESHVIGLQGATIENLCCALEILFGEDAFIISSGNGITQVSSGRSLDCFELNYLSLIQSALPKTCGTSIELYDLEDLSSIAGINCSEDCIKFANDWCDGVSGLCSPLTCDDFTCECVSMLATSDGKSCINFVDGSAYWGNISSIKVRPTIQNSAGFVTGYYVSVDGSSNIPICIKIGALIIPIPVFTGSYDATEIVDPETFSTLTDCIVNSNGIEFYVNICPCPPDCSDLPLELNCETDFPYPISVSGAEVQVEFDNDSYSFDGTSISGEGVNSTATVIATNGAGTCTFEISIIGCEPDCSILPNSINCDDLPFAISIPNSTTTNVTITGTDYSYINGQVVANVNGVGGSEVITVVSSNDNGVTCSKGIIINECLGLIPDCSLLPSSIDCDSLPFVLNVPNATSYSVSFSGSDYTFNSLTNQIEGSGGNDTVTVIAINDLGECEVDINILECTSSCIGNISCTGEQEGNWSGTGSIPNSVPAVALGSCSGDISGIFIDTAMQQGSGFLVLNIVGSIPSSWDSLVYSGPLFPPPQLVGVIDLSSYGSISGVINIPLSDTNLNQNDWRDILSDQHNITATCS